MIIKNLKLTNYRNHNNLKLSFDSSINLLVGDNGVGKTNILESIHLLSSTKSFRAKYDSDLISHDKEFALIEAEISSQDESDKILMQIRRTERSERTSVKKVKINNVAKSLSNFTHYLKSVLFSPEDIDIGKILELGEYIQQKRSEMLEQFNNYFQSSENPYSRYSHNIQTVYEQNLIDTKRLHEYKNREVAAKTTLVGPHRDDFTFYLQQKDMSQFASRGEQRTAMFLMKLAEFNYIYSTLNIKPILLLDDIFSELDPEHREAILSFIQDQQTLITTSSDKELPEMYISKTITLPQS